MRLKKNMKVSRREVQISIIHRATFISLCAMCIHGRVFANICVVCTVRSCECASIYVMDAFS